MSSNQSQKSDNLGIVFDTPTTEHMPEEIAKVVTPQKQVSNPHTPASHLGGQGVFDVERAFSSEHGDTGTIVSDRRHHRPSLGETLAGAWGEWLDKTKRNVEKLIENVPKVTAEETPVIAAPETRTEVIAEAAMHASIAPKDDHHVVVEKLRTMGTDSVRVTGSPVAITPPKPTSTQGTWSHYTPEKNGVSAQKQPPLTPDLRKSTIAPVVTKKITSPVVEAILNTHKAKQGTLYEPPHPQERVSVPVPPPKKQGMIVKSAVHIAPRVQRDSNPTYSAPLPVQKKPTLFARETARVSQKSSWVTAQPKTSEPPTVPTPPPAPAPAPRSVPHVVGEAPVFHGSHAHWTLEELGTSHSQTHTSPVPQKPQPASSRHYTPLTWMVLGGIALLGITLAVVASIYVHVFTKNDEVIVTTQEPSPTTTLQEEDARETIRITSDVRGSLTSLLDTVNRVKPTRTEIRVIVTEGGDERIATGETFLTAIGAHLTGSTLRALGNELRVGSITTTKTSPYIILTGARFDSLFAGLLMWEPTLYTDLSPLFGENPVSQLVFKDVIVSGKPVRVLQNDAGFEVIAYTFLNQNTVIITGDREALEKLLLEL